jgi:hypothetical protein
MQPALPARNSNKAQAAAGLNFTSVCSTHRRLHMEPTATRTHTLFASVSAEKSPTTAAQSNQPQHLDYFGVSAG